MVDIFGKWKRFLQRIKHRIERSWQIMNAERHNYVSSEEYLTEQPSIIQVLSSKTESLVYATINGELKDDVEINRINYIVRNATCFIYSDIIQLEDGRCIYLAKEYERWKEAVDFLDEILLKDTATWCKLKICHQTRHVAKAIKVGGLFGFNYYHFMFQALPKLFETSDIDPSVPLLLDRAAADVASMKQIVEWCNKEKREVIYMDYDVAYKVDELYVISEPNVCVPNWRGMDVESIPASLYSKETIEKVSEYLLSYKDKGAYPKKIFISRKSTKRRAYNEAELWEVAEKYGFVKVYPEELSIAQQMALFNNAKTIIAANGAALSNLIFCSTGSKLIMLCSGTLAVRVFAPLMPIKSGSLEMLLPVKASKGYQNTFEISPKELEEQLTNDKNEANNSK